MKNWCPQIVVLETLESPLHSRRSNQSILKEINFLNIHWKNWCWSWSSNTLVTWCEEPTYWKKLWFWERLRAGGEEGGRGCDGWMVSLTQWTWVCLSKFWQIVKDREAWLLQSMGSQRAGQDLATEQQLKKVGRGKVFFCRNYKQEDIENSESVSCSVIKPGSTVHGVGNRLMVDWPICPFSTVITKCSRHKHRTITTMPHTSQDTHVHTYSKHRDILSVRKNWTNIWSWCVLAVEPWAKYRPSPKLNILICCID